MNVKSITLTFDVDNGKPFVTVKARYGSGGCEIDRVPVTSDTILIDFDGDGEVATALPS